MKKVTALLLFCALAGGAAWSQAKVIRANALSVHETPKYQPGFKHFDYVNANAPKGGTLRFGVVGSFDSFNAYATRGVAPTGADTQLYDTLMVASEDEPQVYYGLVADEVQYPTDYTWIVFHINPKARFQDGTPITAADVAYSYNKFVAEGVPQFKEYFQSVTKVEALDTLSVRFTLKTGSKEILVALGQQAILPKKFWDSHNLGDPLTTPPRGSGAWTVSDFRMGDYVIYQRVANYWGADLPVNVGELNFDFLRYDFYRDASVALEAFKAGSYDYREENVSKNWATAYTGPAVDAGYIVKKELADNNPPGMQALVFNTQRPLFADRRVREAINYALDFEWMNKALFYGQYTRVRSFFQNTKYAATGLPSSQQVSVLNPIRDQVPPEVFSTEYNPPKTDGSGDIRPEIVAALALLKDAGWEIRDTKLVNVKTGAPFELELLIYDSSEERIAVPIKENLARMGITMNIRLVDSAQFTNRLRNRDFDMISAGYGAMFYPSSDLKIYWRSDFINSTFNTAGVQSKAIDYLVDGIAANQGNDQALTAWGSALDRVLTWEFYVIPEWYIATYRVAYWDKFGMPSIQPKYSTGVSAWWFDPQKAAKIPSRF